MTVCLIFISGQQVQIRAGTRFNTVEKFGNRKNFGRFIEEILVLIDKKDSYIYDINNFLTNYEFFLQFETLFLILMYIILFWIFI